MIKNYLKVALRNLWKNKGFSAINIFGLASGLSICLLILFYVTNELGYDQYNVKSDRIYRVDGDLLFGGNHFDLAQAPDPMGAELKANFPQVEQYVRFRDHGGIMVKKGNQNIEEDKVILADSTVFSVFSLPMIAGNPSEALKQPNSVVITESIAKKYFNSTEAVGKTMIFGDTGYYKITGVIKDIPKQSHFHYDFFISMYGQLRPYEINQWASNNFNTYVVLKKGVDEKQFSKLLDPFVMKHVAPVFQSMNVTPEQFKAQGNYLHYTLMPLTNIHLYSNKTGELEANGNIQYVYIFSLIAFFILLIACVNFMNLSTARSANRAKEVGVRKVLGSLRKNLIMQFLAESVMISFVSLLLALLIAALLLPYFNQLSGKDMTLDLFLQPWLLPVALVLMMVVGLIAGSYPAFYLSSFKPVLVLKGKLANGFKSSWLRSGLVIFQFCISIMLVIGTMVIYYQLNYIRQKDVGFDRSQVLIIKNTNALGHNATAFKDEVRRLHGVKNATMTGSLPTSGWRNDSPLFPDASGDIKKAVSTQIWQVDENYIPTLGMQMAQGRNFSPDFPTDSSGIIINEAAAKLFGLQDAVNTPLYFMQNFPVKDFTKYHIIGLVKDFNFKSLRAVVTPLCFILQPQNQNIVFRIQSADMPGLIASIESEFKKMAPDQPFSYSFMDEDFNNLYSNEQRMGTMSVSFSILAILIACLGLLGLITFAAEQRSKEIGIRKVLGAGGRDIIVMLSKDFLKLVLIASLIAIPLSWWAMNKWLQEFAYRIQISWWILAAATSLALIIAMATIFYQALKAALANPVKSLRAE
jgi:putative ABC transport system permease protein